MPIPVASAGGESLYFEVFLGFLATLLATVCGVYLGFGKDRQIDEVRSLEKTANLLSSLSEEIGNNKRIADSNFNLLRELQAADQDADHYVLDTFDIDAWEACQHGLVIERTKPELYRNLQGIYSEISSVNEQIRRLRSESLHSNLGETEQLGSSKLKTWTIDVNYWDSDEDAVDSAGLGDLIQDRCKDIKIDCDSISDDIDAEIERINTKSLEIRSQTVYLPSTDSEPQEED